MEAPGWAPGLMEQITEQNFRRTTTHWQPVMDVGAAGFFRILSPGKRGLYLAGQRTAFVGPPNKSTSRGPGVKHPAGLPLLGAILLIGGAEIFFRFSGYGALKALAVASIVGGICVLGCSHSFSTYPVGSRNICDPGTHNPDRPHAQRRGGSPPGTVRVSGLAQETPHHLVEYGERGSAEAF